MGLVVGSKVKKLIKKQKMNTAGDFLPALDKHLEAEVMKACKRATHNKRKTVRGRDL
jgi:histone H3/H4